MKYAMYMCCHKSFYTIPPLFTPIQCGSELNDKISGVLYDNDGDNISLLNHEYCELTAHYYAWKNIQSDYYGFCHYRRFFAPLSETKKPYIVCGRMTHKEFHALGDEKEFKKLMDKYDIIVPRQENMGVSVEQYYYASIHHFPEDLNLFMEILCSQAPQLFNTAREYLSQEKQYFCNMFIMNRYHFMEYCEIMFSVLKEFDSRKTKHGYFQADRTDGYLGEIFTGIYVTWVKNNGKKILELPRLDVGCSLKKRIGYILFPPETKKRFWVKQISKKLQIIQR